MAYIEFRKIVHDEDGSVKSGSAAIKETVYDSSRKGRCYHPVREKLGKVIYIAPDNKSGIFLSPSRGLVQYDSVTDTFSEVKREDSRVSDAPLFTAPEVHTIFGDAYLLLQFWKKCGLLDVLRIAFPSNQDYERVLAHLLHTVAKDASKIACDDFIEKSFASYFMNDIPISSLNSDTAYFTKMGKDRTKMSFFKAFVSYMRESDPEFGRACYVDSTPLPNQTVNNPFNALCSHGLGSVGNQTRLVLVLDEETGLPVWYNIIAGNKLDISTLKEVTEDVAESLDIRIDSYVLDAGYVSQDVLLEYNIDTPPFPDPEGKERHKTLIARMPAKNGYPFHELYEQTRDHYVSAEYKFIRNSHTYFGEKKEITVFGVREYAYVYVDWDNALYLGRRWMLEHEDLYEKMDLEEKNWYSVKSGFFILVANKNKTPLEILEEYFGRCDIETVFKTGKEYLKLLPLCKWTDTTIRGKILSDCISLIADLLFRKELNGVGISTTKLFGKTQSLMCMKKRNGTIQVEVPNKQVKEYYKAMNIEIPSSVNQSKFTKDVIGL